MSDNIECSPPCSSLETHGISSAEPRSGLFLELLQVARSPSGPFFFYFSGLIRFLIVARIYPTQEKGALPFCQVTGGSQP